MDVSVMAMSQECDFDERIERVLGSFRKYFEEGLLGERSGPVFGGWGSFLPMYKIPQNTYRIPQNPRHSMPHVLRKQSESSTPVRCNRDVASVFALPPQTHGIAKCPTLLPREGAKAADRTMLSREEAKAAGRTLLPRDGAKASGRTLLPREGAKTACRTLLPREGAKAAGHTLLPKQEAKASGQTLLPREGSNAAGLLLPREGDKACLLPREGAKAESESGPAKKLESGPVKKRVPIDQILDDILTRKKQYKLRIVFGSEKGMEKKTGVGEGEGDKSDKVADFSSTKSPAGISKKRKFSDTLPCTPKVADTSSRKLPAESSKKIKVSDTAPRTPKVASTSSRKPPTQAKRSKIWDTVKRINYKHCPEAYVGAKIHRLRRQY